MGVRHERQAEMDTVNVHNGDGKIIKRWEILALDSRDAVTRISAAYDLEFPIGVWGGGPSIESRPAATTDGGEAFE